MNPRTASAAALCCAAVLLLGCNAQNDAENTASEPEAAGIAPLVSYPANAKLDPSARHFLHGQWPFFATAVTTATAIHAEYVEDFLRRPGAGFGRMGPPPTPSSHWTELLSVSSSERSLPPDTAGAGEIQYDPVTETLTRRDGTRLERRELVWLLSDRQLVSVNAEAGPAVYLNSPKSQHELMKPKPDGASAPKRPLDEFEKEALERLRKGDEVALRSSKHELRMLGAIRARKNCLSCHSDAKEGELLGAFTYTLKAQSETTPQAHRLTDLAGLTDQQLWAVRSIEAVGGKVIRAPSGAVTEVRMTFARNQEHEANPGTFSTRLLLRDSALPHLLAFPDLSVLDVSNSLVSDAGLKTIAELGQLKRLDLRDTGATQKGVAELKKALPKCEIVAGSTVPLP